MTIEKMPSSKKERKTTKDKLVKERRVRNKLFGEINQILNKLNISQEQKNQFKKEFSEQFIEILKPSKKEEQVDKEKLGIKIPEYYDEEEFDKKIDELLQKINVTDEEKKKEIKNALKEYYKTSPEKKGINYVNRIENSQELIGLLYLSLPENLIEERKQFESDFLEAIAKRDLFFHLWPSSISEILKYYAGKVEMPKDYKPPKFWKEYQDYCREIQEGRHKITLVFSEDILPENLKNREDLLKYLGDVEKIDKDNKKEYRVSIKPDKIKKLLSRLSKTKLPENLKEHEIGKEIEAVQDLLKKFESIKEKYEGGEELYNYFVSFLSKLIIKFKDLVRERGEKQKKDEELNKLKEAVNGLKSTLEVFIKEEEKERKREKKKEKEIIPEKSEVKDETPIEKSEEKGSEKENKKKKIPWTILEKLKNFGASFVSSIGLWALALGWYLPLWLIVKLQEKVDKEIDRSGKK